MVRFHRHCWWDFLPRSFGRVGGNEQRPLDAFRGRSAVIFSGIGNAKSFHALVEGLGVTVVETLAFPDHVHYTDGMLKTIRAKAKACGADLLVTTEKDADKVAPLSGLHMISVGPSGSGRRF